MRSIFNLFMVYLRSKIYFFQEEKRVLQLFYSCDLFQKCDLALKKVYRFRNPFTISKNFLKKKTGKGNRYLWGNPFNITSTYC